MTPLASLKLPISEMLDNSRKVDISEFSPTDNSVLLVHEDQISVTDCIQEVLDLYTTIRFQEIVI